MRDMRPNRSRRWARLLAATLPPILFTALLAAERGAAYTPAEIAAAAEVARQIDIVSVIADDVYDGRDNATAGSTAIQQVLIDELELIADGLNSGQAGEAAYRQAFSSPVVGTNLLAVIPGTDLASEYVMVGAHYDHLGSLGASIWNGATDNAAGVAAVLAVGKAIDSLPVPPRRSVILALWDAEEDTLAGSGFYVGSPLVPLTSTIAYVNFDIQGANLLPSLAELSFAIASESGGANLQAVVDSAIGAESLGTQRLSRLYGQDRSDHKRFMDNGVPSVFLSDGTGSCYHTPDDDIAVVDLEKLREQSQIGFRIAIALAETSTPPTFVATTLFGGVYEDSLVLQDVLAGGIVDLGLFGTAEQATLLAGKATVDTIVAEGPGMYNGIDTVALATVAEDALAALATLACDGFIPIPPVVPAVPAVWLWAVTLTVGGTGVYVTRRRARIG